MSTAEAAAVEASANRRFYAFAAVLTAVIIGFLAWLLLLRQPPPGGDVDLRFLPRVNMNLNASASVFLLGGYVAIRLGKRSLHKYLMVCALATTTLFLISYVIYHSVHGDTPYPPDAPYRTLYLTILATHVVLSTVLPFLALVVLWFALRGRFARHKKLARVTLPIWFYVSVTGVAIFFMLDAAVHAPH